MKKRKTKICGITCFDDVEIINTLKPDYCGFILDYPESRRFIDQQQLSSLAASIKPEIIKTGVFTTDNVELMTDCLEKGLIDCVQLHQKENLKLIEELKKREIPVIQVFENPDESDLKALRSCKADIVLLDAGKGSGKQLDFNLLDEISRPYFLAGGMDARTIQAFRKSHPHAYSMLEGMDASSALEANGKKDYQKCAAFIAAANEEQNEE